MAIWKRIKKPDPEKEKALLNEIEENGGLEKNDLLAMILGAAIVVLPVAVVVLGLMALIAFLFV